MGKQQGKATTTAAKKRKTPVAYTDQLGDEICRRIAEGESVSLICRDDHMPHEDTVYEWKADPDHPLSRNYARAIEARGHFYGSKVAQVADGVLAGYVPPEVGRVAMDGYKWTAARMAPKPWGDRQKVEHSGEGGGPLIVEYTRGVRPDAQEDHG